MVASAAALAAAAIASSWRLALRRPSSGWRTLSDSMPRCRHRLSTCAVRAHPKLISLAGPSSGRPWHHARQEQGCLRKPQL